MCKMGRECLKLQSPPQTKEECIKEFYKPSPTPSTLMKNDLKMSALGSEGRREDIACMVVIRGGKGKGGRAKAGYKKAAEKARRAQKGMLQVRWRWGTVRPQVGRQVVKAEAGMARPLPYII